MGREELAQTYYYTHVQISLRIQLHSELYISHITWKMSLYTAGILSALRASIWRESSVAYYIIAELEPGGPAIPADFKLNGFIQQWKARPPEIEAPM